MPKRKKPRKPNRVRRTSPEYLLALIDYKGRCEAKMQAFDQLPKTVRAALTASQFNWNVEQLYQGWRERRMNAWQLARHIKNEDRIRLQERRPR